MEAIGVGWTTLVGFIPPIANRGNCMSLITENGGEYHALNLRYEPLEEMLKAGEIDWPLEVELFTPPKGKQCCKVIDERIPKERLTNKICNGCTGIPTVCVGCNEDIKAVIAYNNDGPGPRGPYCVECARKKKALEGS